MSEIAEIARGHWREILPALGLEVKFLENRHGPCPICGGDDRFRFDDRNRAGCYICSQCGAGDGFMLAGHITGLPFHDLADKIRSMLGHGSRSEAGYGDVEEMRQREKMRGVWEGSRRPGLYGPVSAYLEDRVGCLWPSQELREAFYNGSPMMVARILDHGGQRAVNLHLTMLTQDGHKADLEISKRVMKGKLPDGCAIRLAPEKAVMGVAEGIETAISAAIMFDMPVWACINGTLLSKWIPPAKAEQVTIFGDHDANFTGQAKAYHLANRLEVQFKRKANVMIPPAVGHDWNDHLHKTWSRNHSGILRIVK